MLKKEENFYLFSINGVHIESVRSMPPPRAADRLLVKPHKGAPMSAELMPSWILIGKMRAESY